MKYALLVLFLSLTDVAFAQIRPMGGGGGLPPPDPVATAGTSLVNTIFDQFRSLLPYAITILGLFIAWKLIKRMVKGGIGG